MRRGWRVASTVVVLCMAVLAWHVAEAAASPLTDGTADSNGAHAICNVNYDIVAETATVDSQYGTWPAKNSGANYLEVAYTCNWDMGITTTGGSGTAAIVDVALQDASTIGGTESVGCSWRPNSCTGDIGVSAGTFNESNGCNTESSTEVNTGQMQFGTASHSPGSGQATGSGCNGSTVDGQSCGGSYGGYTGANCSADAPVAADWACVAEGWNGSSYHNWPCWVNSTTAVTGIPTPPGGPSEYWSGGVPPPAPSTPTPVLATVTSGGGTSCATAAQVNPNTGVATVLAALSNTSPSLPASGVTQTLSWAWGDSSSNTTGVWSSSHTYGPPPDGVAGYIAVFTVTWTGDGTTYAGVTTASCAVPVNTVTPASGGSAGSNQSWNCSLWDILCWIEDAADWLFVPNAATLSADWTSTQDTISTSIPVGYAIDGVTFVYQFWDGVETDWNSGYTQSCLNILPNGLLSNGPNDIGGGIDVDGGALCPGGWVGAQTSGNHTPYLPPGNPCPCWGGTVVDGVGHAIYAGSNYVDWLATAEEVTRWVSFFGVAFALLLLAVKLSRKVLMAK